MGLSILANGLIFCDLFSMAHIEDKSNAIPLETYSSALPLYEDITVFHQKLVALHTHKDTSKCVLFLGLASCKTHCVCSGW